jgi:hypothetical protein
MDDLATRGHAVVQLDGERVLLLREVRRGSVSYVAPGAATRVGEMPGKTAERAAHEQLGLDVEVIDLLFADTELGVEHFFFLARPKTALVEPVWETIAQPDGTIAAALRRGTLLGYPVRPTEIARRLPRD